VLCVGVVIIVVVAIHNAVTIGVEQDRDHLFITAIPPSTDVPPTVDRLRFPPILSSGPTNTPTLAPVDTPDLKSFLAPSNQTCLSKTNPCLAPSQTPTNTPTNTSTSIDDTNKAINTPSYGNDKMDPPVPTTPNPRERPMNSNSRYELECGCHIP